MKSQKRGERVIINRVFLVLLIYSSVISCSVADSVGIEISEDNNERLLTNNIDFTVSSFLVAYFGKDLFYRRLAEMYLIGVLDATEGRIWCSYNDLLSHSIEELIYSGFKEDKRQFPKDGRASDAILSIMSEISPCN